jgi:hypothetical protein
MSIQKAQVAVKSLGSDPLLSTFLRKKPLGKNVEGPSHRGDMSLLLDERVQPAWREGVMLKVNRPNFFCWYRIRGSNPVTRWGGVNRSCALELPGYFALPALPNVAVKLEVR